jgi:L-alanine-DL-glutamate epimerase-like enolase superfamily enzyme
VTPIVRIALRTDDGVIGMGECVPVRYVTGETRESTVAALRNAASEVVGRSCLRPRELLNAVAQFFEGHPSAFAGLEMAVADVFCQVARVSLWSLCGGAVYQVTTDVTLPVVGDVAEQARAYAAHGFHLFKIKVGRGQPDLDLRVLEDIHRAVPDAVLRLDANQAYPADDALRLIDATLRAGIEVELIEQPVPRNDLKALDTVARRSPVPVFADESVVTPADALRLVEQTCVQGVNVKLMKSGIRGALEVASIACAAGRKLMMGCMLETARGIGCALSVAAGSGLFDFYDLDAHMLVGAEPTVGAFEQAGPVLKVSPI